MRSLPFFLLVLAIEAKSGSRGSSGSRSSVSRASSRSSSSSLRSSSSWRSPSRSSSSSGGWFSFGSSFKSNKNPSTTSTKSSSKSSSYSKSGMSGGSSWLASSSSSKTPRPTASWSIFGGSSASNSRSRGNSAARVAVASFVSGNSRQQKIRKKLSDVASSIVPGAAQRAAQTVRPNLSTYATEYRRRSRMGYYGRSNYYYSSYYPYGTYYRHRYHHNSNNGRYVARGEYQQRISENSTDYELLEDYGNFTKATTDRNETLETQRRFTEISDVEVDPMEIFIPYNDAFLAECPNKVDAFLQLENISFIFEDHHMFLIEDGALNQTSAISDLFLGVHKVDASVYDSALDVILLFQERRVFGFRWIDSLNTFKTVQTFPKSLPDSVMFTPSAAFIWANGYPVLVSDKGDIAIYDSLQNTEIKVESQTTRYLESIPEPVRGMTSWDDDQALVFTENKVYQFDLRNNSVIGEPETLDDFLGCFFVEIPSGKEKKEK